MTVPVAQINIPNNHQASLSMCYGATLDNGTTKTTCSRRVVIDIESDGSGNLTYASSQQNSGVVGATNPAAPFYLSLSISATSPAVISVQPAGYSGGSATGEVRFTIEDIWGNAIEEL